MKKHSKHGEIIKPFGGKFHRNEFSFVGAPCEVIQQLSKQIAQKLEPNLNVGYVDASHGNNQNLEVFSSVYTDMIIHHQLQFSANDSEYKMRIKIWDQLVDPIWNNFRNATFIFCDEIRNEIRNVKLQ